jgi:hypothetical protein
MMTRQEAERGFYQWLLRTSGAEPSDVEVRLRADGQVFAYVTQRPAGYVKTVAVEVKFTCPS